MAGRRDLIRMSPEEVDAFLAGRRTMTVATIGADGRPHLVAMWYGFVDGAPAFWTYARAQKVVNLRRDPRVTCLVEAGDTYAELQGVELAGKATVLEDPSAVLAVGRSVWERYTGPWSDQAAAVVADMGTKRVAVRVDVDKVVSWDHTKLAGAY
ncbi:MAG TPA: PPOX class F420-dependent oxidoreductase [Acidimicrobiales bacterium]|nr:PPOX class F420-dependent oxidoreductase [Acidimicrobiales bacterium]